MTKHLCEKSLFNVLFYRRHKHSFKNFEQRHLIRSNKTNENNEFEWVKNQSNYIDQHGFNQWITHTNGPYGTPSHLKMRSNPYTYTIKFRTNIFHTTK